MMHSISTQKSTIWGLPFPSKYTLVEHRSINIVELVELFENREDDTYRLGMYNYREIVLRFASIIREDDWTITSILLISNTVVVLTSSL